VGIQRANAKRRKPLKILLFGDSGVGKTFFALQSTPGRILVFDAESGTDLYEGREGFDFDYWVDDEGLKTASIRELNKCIDYLESPEGRQKYETFVIDPISDIWENLQAQRMDYKEQMAIKKGKKDEFTNETEIEAFNQKDWADLKKLYKSLMLRLKNLPQNIILIAKEKEVSEVKPNGEVVRTGEYTFDAEKGTKYAVDFIVRLVYDEKTDKRYAIAIFDKVVNKLKDGIEYKGMSQKEENIFTDEEELKEIIIKIKEKTEDLLDEGIDRNVIADTIKSIFIDKNGKQSANYNAIQNIETARKVLEALQKLGG